MARAPHLTITADDIRSVTNDSQLPPETIAAIINKDGMTITYGDLSLLVRRDDYAKVQKHVAKRNQQQRAFSMQSVARALDAAIPKINAGTAQKQDFHNTYADLMLWQALKEAGTTS